MKHSIVAVAFRVPSAIRNFATAYGMCLLLLCCASQSAATELPETLDELIRQTCVDCHEGVSAEAGLDLTSLTFDLDNRRLRDRWVLIPEGTGRDYQLSPYLSDLADFRNDFTVISYGSINT